CVRSVVDRVDVVAARLETLKARAAIESERRNLLLQAPMATALLRGPSHEIELANRRCQAMVGRRELVGKTCLEAFPELAETDLLAILDRVYATGEPYVADEYALTLDPKSDRTRDRVVLRFALEPLRDAESEV